MESEDRKPIFTRKLILIILGIILLVLIVFLLLRNCGKKETNYNVQQITISPSAIGLKIGQNQQLYANVLPSDAQDRSVIWSSSDDTIVSVDANGLVTAIKEGIATITALARDGYGATGQAIVTVGTNLPELEQIQLNKETYNVKVGKTVLVELTPIPTTAEIKDIKYIIYDDTIASVDSSGTIRGLKVGTTTLNVVANEGKVSAIATVNVTKTQTVVVIPPTRVEVTGIIFPSEGCYKLKVGNSYTLAATTTPNNATNPSLKWETSDANIASVDASGTIIGKKQGTVIIKATATSGVYSTFTIKVISSGSEGSCTAPQPSTPSTPGTTPSIKIPAETITPVGVKTEETINTTYNKTNYEIQIIGLLTSTTLNNGANGWLQSANCEISLGGTIPPHYKATYSYRGKNVEFRTRATVSDIESGGITVTVNVYSLKAECADNSDLSSCEAQVIETKSATVCNTLTSGKKTYPINIDNEKPTCSLDYNYESLNNNLILNATDTGGSGLSKVIWENGEQTTLTSSGIARTINDAFNAGTRKFLATVYDQAGNVGTCGIRIDNLNANGSKLTLSELTSDLLNVRLSIGKTTMYLGESTTISVVGVYANGDEIDLTANAEIDSVTLQTYVNLSNRGRTLTFTSGDIFGTNENKKSLSFSVTVLGKQSNVVSLTLLKQGKVTCTIKPGQKYETLRGTWYKGESGVSCAVDNVSSGLRVEKIGVCFADKNGVCTPSLKTSAGNASAGQITGQGKICYNYQTSDLTISTIECSKLYNFDNAAPTCNVSINNSYFEYIINDHLDSSGLNQLTGANSYNWTNGITAQGLTFRYNGNNKPLNTDKVSDLVGNIGACKVPTITDSDLKQMQNEATAEDKYCQVKIDSSVIGEYWITNEQGYIVLNPNPSVQFKATFSQGEGCNLPITQSLLGAIKNFDASTSLNYRWSSSNQNVMTLRGSGSNVEGIATGNGTTTIQVCVGTNNCASRVINVTNAKINPTNITIFASSKISLGQTEEVKVYFTPFNTTERNVTITSSDNSILSVSGTRITARRQGTVSLVAKINNVVSRPITVEVVGIDTKPPTVSITTSNIVDSGSGKMQYVYFTTYDQESNVILNYNLVKGSTCNPTKVLNNNTRNAQAAISINSGGTYTACAKAVDATNHEAIASKTITVNLPLAGSVNCIVSGTTNGNLVIGGEVKAIVRCSSTETITIKSNTLNATNVTATATSNVFNTSTMHTATFNVTIKGAASGTGTVRLPAGAITTTSGANAMIVIGTFNVYAPSSDIPTPSIYFACQGNAYNGNTVCPYSVGVRVSNVPTSVEAVATCVTTSTSCSPTNTTSTASISTSGTYTACAAYRVKGVFGPTTCKKITARIDKTAIPEVIKPTIAITASEAGTNTWTNFRGLISIVVSDDKDKTSVVFNCTGISCGQNGTSSSTKFSRGLIINENGTYTISVTATDSDGNKSSLSKTFIFNKIDKTSPTCKLTFSSNTLTATVTETGSGIATYDDWYRNGSNVFRKTGVSSSGTYSFTVKDTAGNVGICSGTLSVSYSCSDSTYSYSSSSGNCTKVTIRPWGEWQNSGTTRVQYQPATYPTRTTSNTNEAYSYFRVDGLEICNSFGLENPCYVKTTYKRTRNAPCPDNGVIQNTTYCYYTMTRKTNYTFK